MTGFDYLVFAVLGLSGILGILRGFTTEVLTLAAWAGAIFLALYGYGWGAAGFARSFINPDALADFITIIVLFVGGLIAFKMLAAFIGGKIKTSPVGVLDRSLGAFFGLARGVLILALAYLMLTFFIAEDRHPDWIQQAETRPIIAYSARMLAAAAPDFEDRFTLNRDADAILERMRRNMPDPDTDDTQDGAGSPELDFARTALGRRIEEMLAGDSDEKNADETAGGSN